MKTMKAVNSMTIKVNDRMKTTLASLFLSGLCAASALAQAPLPAATNAPAKSFLALPMERTAYFTGETVPLALSGPAECKLEAVNGAGRTTLYNGPAGALWLDTAKLAPGDYALELNGAKVVERFTLTSPLRKSAGSLQDEVYPVMGADDAARILKESGLTACFALGASDMGRVAALDAMARAGTLMLVNPETRPTSFFPPFNNPEELDGMSQRMILTAQANARYPNFGGFCYGWDTTGFAVGGRKGLMTYWNWGEKTAALRHYIARMDQQKMDEFTRRTGLQPVSEAEYIAYLLSIGRSELAPAIDLPTKLWLEEVGRHSKPMPAADLAAFEKRLDAWSGYLMSLYGEVYGAITKNLRAVDPALRNTSSVQSDHSAVRFGHNFPSAYAPLDFQYQSTWNDQVGGPDYLYQWLLVDALLEMERGDKPTWISNALGTAHHRAAFPGKFLRVAAHGLAFGVSGVGFAHEGFSNILGGMAKDTNWEAMKGKAGEADLVAGRDFLARFAALAVEARGAHGVGILWSKTQYGRQHAVMGFGNASYNALVTLARLGYTPRFVTEDEIATGCANDVAAMMVIGQTFAMPEQVNAGLAAFTQKGGRILVDGSTTVALPGAEKMAITFPFTVPGKPHSWTAPNMVGSDNDTILFEREYPALAKALSAALGDTGHAWLKSEKGLESRISLLTIDGGRDARYLVAVNDSWVATQADWHQVRETLSPVGGTPHPSPLPQGEREKALKSGTSPLPSGGEDQGEGAGRTGFLYDCTDEKALGGMKPFDCDLSRTTARVFAALPREPKGVALSATQSVKAGDELTVAVEFQDAKGKRLEGVLPFHLTLRRPDGTAQAEFYRSTTREGTFAMTVPTAANDPAGKWTVEARSQLTGELATLPVDVAAAKPAAYAAALAEPVVVRQREAVEATLAKGATVVLPVFDAALLPVAEQVKATLAKREVTVEVRQNPATNTYTIAYDLTDAQKQENARCDRGESFGKIKRDTVNANDWASALSGWRYGKPLILLDLVGAKGANPMAQSLAKEGMLWPQVTAAYPGQGRAVVQALSWAFAPRATTVVIQAADVEGLMAGAKALATLPEDRLTPAITATKAALWQQFHIGGKPASPKGRGLTAKGLAVRQAPQPFAMAFPGEKPLAADQVKHPVPVVNPAHPVPGVFLPKQWVLQYKVGDAYVETATADMLVPDLRFSEAVKLIADVKTPGKTKLVATGVFRYSDRKPCWQAQWEDIIELREKLVPAERKPMEFEVRLNGQTVGKLLSAKTEQKEVPLELASASAGLKPKTVVEEVVTELSGEIDLPAGRQEILLIHRNVVDGKLEKIVVGE